MLKGELWYGIGVADELINWELSKDKIRKRNFHRRQSGGKRERSHHAETRISTAINAVAYGKEKSSRYSNS